MSVKVSWFLKENEYLPGGNYYGYHNAIFRTKEAAQKLGMQISGRSPIHISYCAPHAFEHFQGKFNVLITMYETPDTTQDVLDRVRKADLIIVPSKFCQRFYRKWTGKRVEVVPLGTDHVPYVRRSISQGQNEKFRFLWTGAFNARKGWWHLGAVWDTFFKDVPFVELYIKTTSHNPDLQNVFQRGNTITDGRNVSREEMIKLYHSAHCFVMPTMGEGWGLTVAEAMSSGCPTITTEYSGMLEFANRRNCFFAPHKLERIEASMGGPAVTNPTGKYEFALVDLPGLAKTMATVMHDYENSLIVGKRAHQDLQKFTWERSAQGILDIIKDL